MSRVEALSRTILLARDWIASNVTDEAIAEAFQNTVVRISTDERVVNAMQGQTAIITLATLIARMGVQVELDFPEATIIGFQRPVTDDRLIAGLCELGNDLVPGSAITSSRGRSTLRFILGAPHLGDDNVSTWRINWTDWAARLAPSDVESTIARECLLPFGGMAAAALAAAEVFKQVIRGLPLADPFFANFLAAVRFAEFDFGEGPCLESQFDLGSITMVSAGAITQAMLFVLFRLPNISADALVFEDDVTVLSNINRNMLTTRSDVDILKSSIVVATSPPAFRIHPENRRFSIGQTLRHGDRVIIGADDIQSRWQVQRSRPRWLGIGATSHVEVSCSSHRDGEACGACLHRIDEPNNEPIPTVSFVSFWAGLALAVRLVRDVSGAPYGAERQHLWLTPLRMDERRLSWSPVVAHPECAVRCAASRLVRKTA